MKVDIDAMNYHHFYDIQFAFDKGSIKALGNQGGDTNQDGNGNQVGRTTKVEVTTKVEAITKVEVTTKMERII